MWWKNYVRKNIGLLKKLGDINFERLKKCTGVHKK